MEGISLAHAMMTGNFRVDNSTHISVLSNYYANTVTLRNDPSMPMISRDEAVVSNDVQELGK